METYQNTDLLTTYNGKGSIVAVLRQLEILFRQMQMPDVEGIQIYSLLAQNLEGDGKGNFTITVDTLENVVEIIGTPSLFLRNHSGVLQVSADNKLTWSEIGSGSGGSGSGDMLKSTYDGNNDGIIDAAAELYDGNNTATAAQVRGHLDNSAIHAGGDMLKSVYDADQDGIVSYAAAVKGEDFFGNAKTYTVIDIAGHIDNGTLHVPDGNFLPLVNRSDNPDTDESWGKIFLKNNSLYCLLPDGTLKQIAFVS